MKPRCKPLFAGLMLLCLTAKSAWGWFPGDGTSVGGDRAVMEGELLARGGIAMKWTPTLDRPHVNIKEFYSYIPPYCDVTVRAYRRMFGTLPGRSAEVIRLTEAQCQKLLVLGIRGGKAGISIDSPMKEPQRPEVRSREPWRSAFAKYGRTPSRTLAQSIHDDHNALTRLLTLE